MQPFRILASFALIAALGASACGDDTSRPGADAGPDDTDSGPDPGDPDGGPEEAGCAPTSLDGRIDSGGWDDSFTIAGLTGYDGFTPTVRSLVTEPDGSILAAGYFLWAGSERVGPLARLRDGAWEPARPDLEAVDLSAVAVDDGRTAIATFMPLAPVFNPDPQTGEILVDDGDGLVSVGSFTGVVRKLAWVDGDLWVAGHFSIDGGPTELAVWDGEVWSAPPGGPSNGPVYELHQAGGSVYVGGSFSQIGGIESVGVAEWTGTEWRALSMAALEPSESFGAFHGPVVFGLARDLEGELYAGGLFFPGDISGGVAHWTGDAWEVVGSGLTKSGGLAGDEAAIVADIALHQGALHAIGCFTHAGGGDSTPLPGVGRWNGESWEALPGSVPGFIISGWFQAFVCGGEPSGTAILEAPLQTLHSTGDLLLVGGAMAGVDGAASQSVIAHDGDDWVPVGAPAGKGIVGAPAELAVGASSCDVYAFGGMSHAGDVATAGAIARFDGERWSAVAPPPEGAYCEQLAVSPEGVVYIGCDTPEFTPGVYRLDDGAWTLLPIPDVEGSLGFGDLAFDGQGRLWAVGGAGISGWVARLDGDAFTIVEDGFDGNVTRVAFPPGDEASDEIVVGGSFSKVGELAAGAVARFDGTSWQALGDGVTSTPQENPVSALAWTEDAIYASTYLFGSESDHAVLRRWDGSAWEELGVPERGLPPHIIPDSQHQIMALFARGDHVVAAGGIYPELGGRNVYVFDGESFSPLAGGVGATSVTELVVTPDALWFGGSIATTGAGGSLAPSGGVARFQLGDAR